MIDLKQVKLVVTDMDGTLLNSSHEVSQRFFSLQRELGKRGIQFVAASGRQYHSIALKLAPVLEDVIVIAENGGLVRHQQQELLATPLDRDVRDRVLTALQVIPGAHCVLCGKDKAYLLSPSEAFRNQLSEYYAEFQYLDNLKGFPGEIMKIAVYHFESAEKHIYPAVKSFKDLLKVKVSGINWVDISDPMAHKGHALELIQQQWGIPPEQTLAFGDYNNDLEMLERARFSFAMANAHPNVIKKASYKTLSNEEQGVEHILQQLLDQLG